MIWAIDLDDGTLIDQLGTSLNRTKALQLPDIPFAGNCFGISDCVLCDANITLG